MDILSVISPVLISLIMIVVQAFALSAVVLLVTSWTWLYTLPVPRGYRDDHRAQIRADLHDQIVYEREQGHQSAEIATKILFRAMWCIKGDIAWSASWIARRTNGLPIDLASSLERGSKVLAAIKPPTKLLTAIATLGLMNWVFFMAEDSPSWKFWLGLNVFSLATIVVLSSQQHAWARIIVKSWMGLSIVLMACFSMTMVFQYQLYEVQEFYIILMAILPMALSVLVTTRTFKVHAFRHRLWPIWASWATVFGSALLIAVFTGWLAALLMIWGVMVLAVFSFLVLCVISATGVIIAWHIGLMASRLSMRMLAAGIRRLT